MSDKNKTLTVQVPDIGDFDAVDVIEVLVKPGDSVKPEDPLITLESDKATMEIPAPIAGTVKSVLIREGDSVSEGDAVVELEMGEIDAVDEKPATAGSGPDTSAASSETSTQAATDAAETPSENPSPASRPNSTPATPSTPSAPSRKAPPVPFDASVRKPGKVAHASPAIRKFARELGVDIAQVPGSGPKGRITREDVQRFVKGILQTGASAVTASGDGLPKMPEVDFSQFGPVEIRPLSRIQKLSGKNLWRNWVRIPHVTQFEEADITELERFRQAHKHEAKAQGFNLTPLAFLVKAVTRALKQFPTFNASLDAAGENLILKDYYHIGVAVDTPDGLVVPVIRNADQKGIFDIARELADISQRAREKKLKTSELQGGTFSISSLGGIGGTAFTPIINAPEVAILGVSKHRMQPLWNGEEFVPRLMLPLSLSYDHRVIDGAAAARFSVYLAEVLADMKKILL